jgi:acyl-CoA synthetase (NDP forming)
VLGGAGGGTVEAADLCHEAGLELTPIPQEIRNELRDKIPHAWDWVGNPIDASIIGFGEFNETHILQMMAAHPAYDLILINFHVERALRRMGLKELPAEVAEGLRKLSTDNGKALAVVIDEPELRDEARLRAVISARDVLGKAGIAVYPTVERAVRSIGVYVRYQAEREARRA